MKPEGRHEPTTHFDSSQAWADGPQQSFTGPQVEYLSIHEQFGLWRAGNQIGKSYALAADIVMTARGVHAYRTVKPAPVRIMVISYSEAQMKPLIWKIWQFLDQRETDPKLRCSDGAGLQGYKDRFIEFVAGPGKDSIIFFATYKAGTQAMQASPATRSSATSPCPSPSTVRSCRVYSATAASSASP